MAPVLLQFAVSAAVIAFAGSMLTRYADAIAELTGLGRLLVGSIFLAAATSLPELTIDISAVRMGLADMAVGDLLGSSLFNLLILAGLDLWHHSAGKMLSRAAAAHALSATMSVALTALAAMAILIGPQLEGFTFLGLGAGSMTILLAYAAGFRLVYYDQRFAASRERYEIDLAPPPAPGITKTRAIIGYLAAAAVILVAAPFLAQSAGRLADLTGLGGTFVGTTLVALCTSLPEMVTSLAAVRIKAFDLALGNIFGSNAFNMLLLAPLDLACPGSLFANISQTHVLTALAAILVTAVAVLGQLYQVERRVRFLEPDAIAVIVLILTSLAAIYYLRPEAAEAAASL